MSKKRKPLSKARHFLECAALRALIFFLRPLSAKTIFRLGQALGALSYSWAKKRKQTARINLDIAFGDKKSDTEKNQIIKNSFTQLAVSALQCLWIWTEPQRVHQLIED